MTDTQNHSALTPGPDHPIVIADSEIAVRVSAGPTELAASAGAVELREHVYPPVLYVDRSAIDMRKLERSDKTSWCPYKGEATYFHILLDDGTRLENAVWTYETPFEAVAQIHDRLGFYTDRVSVERV